VDPGKWKRRRRRIRSSSRRTLSDAADGYGYIYHKVIRLVPGKPGKPQTVIEHRLKNTGKKPIE
jgi:hypothetical protein